MRKMGQRRKVKNPLPGMTLGLALILGIALAATHRSNKLLEVALGNESKTLKLTKDDHPPGADRNFLQTVINQAIEGGK